jgi:hypothetical protein
LYRKASVTGDALASFMTHARSSSHRFTVELVSHYERTHPISSQLALATQVPEEQRTARSSLAIIFSPALFPARQGLAFRGHANEEGSFEQPLQLRSRDHPHFRRWLECKIDYTSPQSLML